MQYTMWPALQSWQHVCEHAVSVHAAPLLLSTALAVGLWCCHVHVLWCLVLALCGVGGVAFFCYIQPLPSLTPAGGTHHVGLRELHADAPRNVPPVTVFYPTSEAPPSSRARRLRWLPFDDQRYLHGLARYARVPYALVRDLRLVRVCATIDSTPLPLFDDAGAPRPVFVFSHGLSAFARTYSTLLMNLAARGALVFAMTHMDGSAAFCRDASEAVCVPFAAALPLTPAVREPQLRQRIAETRRVLAQLRSGALLRALHYADDDVARFLRASPAVTLVGHSFGGATALAALTTTTTTKATTKDDSSSSDDACVGAHVDAVVAFDPWHTPLEGELFYAAIRDGRAHYTTPTLMLQSEEWVRYDESWRFVHKLCAALASQTLSPDEHARLAAAARRMRDESDKSDDNKSKCNCNNDSKCKCNDDNNNCNNDNNKCNDDDDEQLSQAAWVDVRQCGATGHRTCTDVALLSPVVSVPKYITAPSAAQMVRWAEQALHFALLHARSAHY